MIRIILVRHGRTGWNVGTGTPDGSGQDRRFRGLIDLPLSREGIAQAQATAGRLAHVPVTAIYSSPLRRAADTAQIISKRHALSIELVPGLRSMDYGDWAGHTHTDVRQRWPDQYLQWRHNPFEVEIPGGEHTADLCDRAVDSLRDALSHHADGETLVIVSHQVVTRILTCAMARMPDSSHWTPWQALCNLTTFDFDPSSGTFVLVGLNDTNHLNPALPGAPNGSATRVVLLRHGQTAWNAEPSGGLGAQDTGQERFRGRSDVPLNAAGHAQARTLCRRLQDEPISAIYTSPLRRTRQTIAPLVEVLGPTQIPVQAHEGLLDIDYGEFQGLTHAEASRTHPKRYELWRTAPSRVRFPAGEGLAELQGRALALLDAVTACPGQTVALVGHQIVNKVIACTLLGLDLDQIWRIRQDTGGINVYQKADRLWRVLRLNDTFHLRNVQATRLPPVHTAL